MSIGIDISPSEVTLAFDGKVVTAPYSGDFTDALRFAVQEHGLSGQAAIVIVRASQSFSRVLTLEHVPTKKAILDQVVGSELEAHLPLDLEDLAISYSPLPAEEGEEVGAFLTTAVPIEKGSEIVRQVELAGLTVKRVVSFPGAAATLIGQVKETSGRARVADTIALVDVGREVTELCVSHQDAPIYARSIQRGTSDLSSAIQRTWNCDVVQAEELMNRYGAVANVDDEFAARYNQVVGSELFAMQRDLGRALQATVEASHKKVDLVVLGGSASSLPGVASWFESKLGMPVVAASELGVGDAFLAEAASAYAANRRRDFDLKLGQASSSELAHLFQPALRIALALGIVSMFGVLALLASVYSQREETAALRAKVAAESTRLYGGPLDPSQIDAIDNEDDTSVSLLPDLSAYDVLLSVSAALPKPKDVSVEVDKISIDETQVVIDLRAKSSEEIVMVEKSLKNIGCLKLRTKGDERLVANEMTKASLTYDAACWRKDNE